MGINSQPNNRNWGKKDNLAIANEIYEHDELNLFPTTNSPSVEYPSNAYAPYEDSDVGDSLRETREMGKSRKDKGEAIAKKVGAWSIATVTAVTLVSNILQSRPVLEEPTIVISDGYRLEYEFALTSKNSITAFVDIRVDLKRMEEQTFRLDISSEEAEPVGEKERRFVLSGVFEDLPQGYYEFRIYCQFGFGKNSIYSQRGTIGE